MLEPDLFKIFITPLNSAEINYMATGSAASIVYGEPRMTHDIDLVVELKKSDAPKLRALFPEEEFYCPPLEIIEVETRRPLRGHFNLIHYKSGFKADIYLKGEDALHHWAIANRKKVDLSGTPIWLAPPEYVILRKLEFHREGGSEKHIRDILGMLETSADLIDEALLEKKAEQLGLLSELAAAREQIN